VEHRTKEKNGPRNIWQTSPGSCALRTDLDLTNHRLTPAWA